MHNRNNNEPIRFSSEQNGGFSNDKVDREAGVIRGISVMSRGDALGKKTWIDSTFINQLAQFGKEAGDRGIEAHLTHEHLQTGEGVTSLLGRMTNFSVVGDGEKVKADLSFVKSAFSSPQGNLAKFVMDVAEDAHDLAGMSIIAIPDQDAMFGFIKDNGGVSFKSPDSDNKDNFPHFRAMSLKSVDLTNSPSSNPSGLFSSKDSLSREKEAVIFYETEVQEMDTTQQDAALEEEAVEKPPVEEDPAKFSATTSNEIAITQSDVAKAVAEGIQGDRERAFSIRERAEALGQDVMGEKFVEDGTPLNIALGFMNEQAFKELKAARVVVGLNAEDNELGSKKPKTKAQELGTEVSEEDVDAYMAQHEGISFADAMNEVSKQAIGKGV